MGTFNPPRLWRLNPPWSPEAHRAPHEVPNDNDYRGDQHDVDEGARMEGQKAQGPQGEQDYCDQQQHFRTPYSPPWHAPAGTVRAAEGRATSLALALGSSPHAFHAVDQLLHLVDP